MFPSIPYNLSETKDLNIIFEGDSITLQGLIETNLLSLINRDYISNNIATNGATINNVISRISTVNGLYDSAKDNVIILYIGTNDASDGTSFSKTLFASKLLTYKNSINSNYKLISLGLTDLLGEDRNYAAQLINEYHRLNWSDYTDIFCDIYQIPECQDHTNTTYFTDGIHHKNALDILIAQYIYYKSYRILK